MTSEEDLLRRVRLQQMIAAQQAPPQQPPVPPPVDATVGTAMNNRAAQLEQQAQPAPGPRGLKENIVAGLRGGMEAFSNPHNYAQIDLQRQQMEQQRQNELLTKAQQLRGQAQQQNQFETNQHRMDVAEQNDQDYRNRKLTSDEAHQKALLDQGKFAAGAEGIYNTHTGEVTTPPPVKPTSAGNRGNFQRDTQLYNGKATDVLIDVDPDSPTAQHVFLQGGEDVTGKTSHYETPAKYGEPLQVIFDPASGQNVLQPRSAVKPGAIAAQAPGTLKEEREIDNANRKIDALDKAYSDQFVGPAMGRYLAVKAKLPGTSLPEGYGTFIQLQADLKNSVVKLITGAQMGQQEADRILAQVPVETDKPEIWRSKFEQTKKNAQYIQGLIDRQVGKGAAPAGGVPPKIDFRPH